jgi:hypothetical protein
VREQLGHIQDYNQSDVRRRVWWIEERAARKSRGLQVVRWSSVSSVIDSEHGKVVKSTISGVEIRHAMTTAYTDSSLNIAWMQVDNQLLQPVSTVIRLPTHVKFVPLRGGLKVSENNLLSQLNLTSYKTVLLVGQEPYLRLEHQTLLSMFKRAPGELSALGTEQLCKVVASLELVGALLLLSPLVDSLFLRVGPSAHRCAHGDPQARQQAVAQGTACIYTVKGFLGAGVAPTPEG